MLTIFKRHTGQCKKDHALPDGTPQDMGRKYRRCTCPLHTEGTLGGVMIRRALDTASWTRAQAIVRERETLGHWDLPAEKPRVTIAEAATTFLASLGDKRAVGTRRKIRSVIVRASEAYVALATTRHIDTGLLEYAELEGLRYLDELTLPVLIRWRASWHCGEKHAQVRVRITRRFFYFCIAAEYCSTNPAKGIDNHSSRDGEALVPKMPFDHASLPSEGPEWLAMESYLAHPGKERLRALVYLMRYAGLRISDAVQFSTSKSDGSTILLHMAKTREPVVIPMHPKIAAALAVLTPNSSGYYFCSGSAALATYTDNWRVRCRLMWSTLAIPGGHPHRFRHTFAVDLLLRGVAIDQVSQLLGHRSVRVTEAHYLSFVAARRAQLRDAVALAWGLPTTSATPPAPPTASQPHQEAA